MSFSAIKSSWSLRVCGNMHCYYAGICHKCNNRTSIPSAQSPPLSGKMWPLCEYVVIAITAWCPKFHKYTWFKYFSTTWFKYFSTTLYDVFLHMAGVFSKFRPRACTCRSEPYSCLLAYGRAQFGPFECKFINECVLCLCAFKMHLFAYDWCLTPSLCVHGLFSPTRCILLYFSSAPWPKVWIKCTTCRRCVWQSALHHRGKQCPGESFAVPILIQLHLLQGRRTMMKTMFPRYFRRIPHLRTHNHPWNHRRSRVSQRHRNREVIIAHENGRFTIDNYRLRTKSLVENWADLFCSLKFALFKWPFSSTLHIHALLLPVTALYHSFPQVRTAHFAQGWF